MTRTETLAKAVIIGCDTTATMDVAGEIIRAATGVRSLDLGLVGRWNGHFTSGRLVHDSIATSEPIEQERAIGLLAHYAIGTGSAAALLAVNPAWRAPTDAPAPTRGSL